MATLKGQVRGKSSMVFNGKWGDVELWSFQVEGDNRYFRTGKTNPPVSDGDTISFEYETKQDKNNVDVDTITKIAAEDVQQAPKPSGPKDQQQSTSGNTGGSTGAGYYNPQRDFSNKDNYWARKEARDLEVGERINFSASQRDAVSLVSAALAHDCLSFGNAAKGKKLDMLLESVDKVTERFVKQREESTGGGE